MYMSSQRLSVLLIIVVLLTLLNACAPKPSLWDVADNAIRMEVWRQNQHGKELLTIDVADKGILSGLATLLAQAVDAGSREQFSEYCDLVFCDSKATKTRLPVYSCENDYVIRFGGELLLLPKTFIPSLDLLGSLPQASGKVAEADRRLLARYGKSVVYRIATYQVALPPDFLTEPGSMPVGAYWFASNVLSRDIGLDFSSLLGEDVEIAVYKLSQPLEMEALLGNSVDETTSRAIILHHNSDIVGVWLDTGPGIGCSLDGNTFTDLEPQGISVLAELTASGTTVSRTPEELIRSYFAAIDAKDYAKAHDLEDISFIMKRYMFAELGFDQLYQPQFAELARRDSPMSLSNLKSCKLTSLTPASQGR